MRTHYMKAGALAALASLAACTSGQVGAVPPSVSANLGANTLQLAVGTANIGLASTMTYSVGTNVVATYRQPNGLSGTLVNSPTLTGPSGWTVPAGTDSPDSTGANASLGSGSDAGTTSLTSFPQGKPTPPPTGAPGNTFGGSGGVFAYGFAPENSNNQYLSGTNFGLYGLPFFGNPGSSSVSTDSFTYQGGPPAYSPGGAHPNIRDGFYPSGFTGYTQGFTDLLIPPQAGTYSLTLVVPSSPTSTISVSQSATLPAGAPVLGNVVLTAFTPDTPGGDGGGSVTLTVPPGATETVVDVQDQGGGDTCHAGSSPPFNYSVVVRGTGPQTATIPAGAGPLNGSGQQQPAFCQGDTIQVQAVAADYPLFESGPPQSTAPNPTIVGAGGTADIATAIPGVLTYAPITAANVLTPLGRAPRSARHHAAR